MRLSIIPKKTVQLNYVLEQVPDLMVKKGKIFRKFLWSVRSEKERRFVNRVETLDQMVEVNYLVLGLFFFRDANRSSKEICTMTIKPAIDKWYRLPFEGETKSDVGNSFLVVD